MFNIGTICTLTCHQYNTIVKLHTMLLDIHRYASYIAINIAQVRLQEWKLVQGDGTQTR